MELCICITGTVALLTPDVQVQGCLPYDLTQRKQIARCFLHWFFVALRAERKVLNGSQIKFKNLLGNIYVFLSGGRLRPGSC